MLGGKLIVVSPSPFSPPPPGAPLFIQEDIDPLHPLCGAPVHPH